MSYLLKGYDHWTNSWPNFTLSPCQNTPFLQCGGLLASIIFGPIPRAAALICYEVWVWSCFSCQFTLLVINIFKLVLVFKVGQLYWKYKTTKLFPPDWAILHDEPWTSLQLHPGLDNLNCTGSNFSWFYASEHVKDRYFLTNFNIKVIFK